MFYDVFTSLCEKKGVTPNKALTDCGISRTSPAKWREGATPRGVTLQKLADYFGVTTDYLLTGEDTKKAPGLTEKDRRDVAKLVENIMSDMEQAISYDIVAIVRADLWGVFFSSKDKVRNRQDVSSFLSFY